MSFFEMILHSVLCGDYTPQRPLNREDRPDLELPASQLEDIVNLLRNRGHFTHEAWGRCLATLETVKEGDAESGPRRDPPVQQPENQVTVAE